MFQGFLAQGLTPAINRCRGAGLGSVLIDANPLVVALLSSWLFGEIIGWFGWLGLTLGIFGICAISLPSDLIMAVSFNLDNLANSGELLMLFAGL